MAKYSSTVEYNVKTTLDASGITKLQSELTKVKTALDSLSGSPGRMKRLGLNVDEVTVYQHEVEKLSQTISKCFNSKTGMLNLSQFNSALKSGALSVSELNGAFKATGNQGKAAFNSMVAMMTNVNKQAVTVNSTMSKIANTFGNTVRWGITASIFQEMMSSVQGAVSYMKDLDESLTNIQMVTNSSKEDMRELALYANQAAQELGSTTTDYTNAVKVFVQEGFSEAESKQYATLSTKLANVSEQNTQTTSDQITAYRNAFQLDFEQTVEAMDKVANVANNTASNVSELMTASQRSASVAQAVGASQDSFLAAIATIESVTRQSAEEIGNGLKTIYQRFADIRVGKTLDDGADYGEYAQALKKVGVDVLDMEGNFKGFDQILTELQQVWGNLSETMKVAVGEKVAGKFQYNRFVALMNNPEYYQKSYAATQNADGMMDQMNDIYIQSIEGRLNTLQAAGEQVMSSLFDQDSVEPMLESVTDLVNGFNTIIETVGGGIPVFTAFSAILLKAFSPQIASQIAQIATNIATMNQASKNMNVQTMREAMATAGQIGAGLNSKTYDVANRGMISVRGLDGASQEKMSLIVQQMAESEERELAAENKINEVAAQITDKYSQRLGLTEKQAEGMQRILSVQIKENSLTTEQLRQAAQSLGLKEEQLQLITLSRSELNGVNQAYREMDASTQSVKAHLEAANTSIQGFHSEQIAKGFTDGLSALTSFAFALQSMTSLFSILNDESASFEQKFNAILISGTMGISMIAGAIGSLKSGFSAIAEGLGFGERAVALEAQAAAEDRLTAAEERLNIAKERAAKASLAAGIAEQQLILTEGEATSSCIAESEALLEKARAADQAAAAELRAAETEKVHAKTELENAEACLIDAEAKVADTGATEANSKATLGNVVALGKETLAKKLDAVASGEAGVASKLYAISEKALTAAGLEAAAATTTLVGRLAMIAAPVVGIVAAIGALVSAYKAWQDSIHAASNEFEKQKELFNTIKKNYTDIRDETDALKKSLDSLKDSQDSLDGLVQGTDEWREAVNKLNSEVLELLQTYPELAEFTSNKDGVLTIESRDLDQFYAGELDQVRHLQDMATLQQTKTLAAQNDKYIEDFHNKWGTRIVGDNITKEEISKAISDGTVSLEGESAQLNAAFAELSRTIQSNNHAIENLNGNIGTLTDYKSYAAGDIETDTSEQREALIQEYGTLFQQMHLFGMDGADFSTDTANDTEFLAAMSEALGKNIVSGSDVSLLNDHVKFLLANGEELELSSDQILQILATSKQASEIEKQILEENIDIYKRFGATYNEELKQFEDSTGEVITSLDQLAGVTEEQSQIMSKFANDSSYKEFMTDLYGGTKEFADFIASNRYTQDTSFKDREAALDQFLNNESFQEELKKYSEQYNYPIETIDQFAEAIEKGIIEVDGLSEALAKLTPETVDLTHNINGNEFTNRVDFDEEGFDDFLKEQDMSKGAFNRMARDLSEEEGGYFDVERRALEELIDVKQADGIVTQQEAEEIENLNSKMEGLDESAKDTSAMLLQMSNGVVELRNNIDDISEILTNDAAKGTSEWYEALDDLDAGLSKVLNIDAGTLSDEFLENGDALAYAQRMAEGDMTAIDDLRKAAAQDIVQNLNIQVSGDENVDEIRAELMSELNQLQADIDAGKITVTTDLDTYPFIQKLNTMLEQGQISAEQASQILSSIGMEANIRYAEGEGEVDAIEYRPTISMNAVDIENPITGGTMLSIPGIKMEPSVTKVPTTTRIPYLEGAHYTGPGVQTANTAARNPGYTGKYSGNPKKGTGGNKGKNPSSKKGKNNQKKDKQTSEWDYLTDITNDLDRAAAAMEKLSKLEDRLYGSNRVSQIKKLQKEYKNYINLLDKEVKLAQKHARRLRTKAKDENGNLTINGYANRAGISKVKFDAQGNLENGREIEQALLKRVNVATKTYNKHRNDEDPGKYEYDLNKAKEDYEGFLKAMSEYESTLGTIEDGQNEIQEYLEKIQDAADEIIDSIQQGVEDLLKARDNQREFNKLYRDWSQGGSGYSHFSNERQYYTEGLKSLLSPSKNGKSVFDIQLASLNNRFKDAKDVFDVGGKDKDDEDHEKLSQQAAFENLQGSTEDVMESLKNMIGYYDSLLDGIQEMSSKMDDLIDSRLEQFDNIEDYLDTRLDQLQLLFGDDAYEEQERFYNQKILTNMEKMVSLETAIKAKQATAESLKSLEASGKELSTEERKTLQEAREKVTELQKEQLDTESTLLEDIANKLRAQTSAEMNNLTKELFNGADVDWLSQQWEVATRNADQYLDDYNKAYELQKLELKFQEALNDAQETSLGTQQKIQDLADEYLTYLREKEKISEYDVKHAQMQLEILQKQIALEDARDSKSQMRLQRNAAGNYDFVYGADEDAIAKARESLLDAQQESYNLSKQQYLETYESAYEAALKTKDMVVQIATDASIAVEERANRITFILESLNEYLGSSSVELGEIAINLYNSFVDAEQTIAEENQESLTEVFDLMREHTNTFQEEFTAGTTALQEGMQEIIYGEGGVISSVIDGVDQATTAVQDGIENVQTQVSDNITEIEGSFNDSTENIQTQVGSTIEDVTGSLDGGKEDILSIVDGMQDYITNAETGVLSKIRKEAGEKVGGIQKDVLAVITTIDQKFDLSKDHTLAKVKDIEDAISTAITNITTKDLPEFTTATDEALATAGDAYQTFADDCINYASEQLEELSGDTQNWENDLNSLQSEIGENASAIESWKTQIDKAINSAGGLLTKANKLQESLAIDAVAAGLAESGFDDAASAADTLGSAIETMSSSIENGYQGIAGAAEAAAGAISSVGDAYRDMEGAAWNANSAAQWANQSMSDLLNWEGIGANVSSIVSAIRGGVQGMLGSISIQSSGSNLTRLLKTFAGGSKSNADYIGSQKSWLDTGGYTGTWHDKGIGSKNGKLAVLHQKELVLNAEDTENILSAVDIVRDIMSGMDSLSSLGRNQVLQTTNTDTIEQRVEINATFPGVTEAIEIKQALEHLADSAYQTASRYK